MFGAEDDDTDFLSPTGGAKLASLFGMDQSENRPGNESFQYTAPKQPKKGPAGPKPPKPSGPAAAAAGPAPSVLFATAVHAYKFVGGQYVKQGKFGAAVLGNHSAKEYRILLYISQQQPVTSTRIHPGLVFTVQQNNYATFYDDQRQNWSVMFESEAAAAEFSKQVCIARCNGSASLEGVLCQDLLLGDGPAADAGDLLEVAYTGWLFQNQGLGQVFDSNVQKDKMLRLKLGSGKVIKGWEEGMLGMKRGGRRLLIIPPALGYGAQGLAGRIPPNSTLVFEVEVKRMKVKDLERQSVGSRDSPVSLTDSLPQESLPQAPTSVPPQPGEPAVRAKSNSISEQLANPDMAKAKLISRMARMGQPMLPFLAGSGTPQPDSSDSDMEDPNIQRLSPHPAAPLLVRPTPQTSHTPAPAPQTQPAPGLHVPSAALLPVAPLSSQAFPPAAPGFQPYAGIQYSASAAQLQPMGSVYPPQIQQPAHFQAAGDVTAFLMTEARQHSTEIRMSVSKIADKIDNLASKVDNLQKENSAAASHLIPGISSITMESAMIMNNIQRIVQENERLKQEVLDKSSRIEEQNAKIGELIARNQRYVEQSNRLMEQRNDSLQTTAETTQAKVLHAMKEKVVLAEELAAATNQVSRLQLEVTTSQKKEMELRTRLEAALQDAERNEVQLSSLRVQLIEAQETSERTKSRAKTEKDGRRQLEARLAALEEEAADLKAEKENLEKSLAERTRRSRQDRQRAEEEQEEIRRTFQDEIEDLKQILKKTREQAAAGQRSSGRDLDEQRLAELEVQAAELQPLRDKCAKLQSQLAALTEEYRKTRSKVDEAGPAKDTTEEVKKIMNGVFQSLRSEFDLEETYSGRAVLATIMSTIKTTTLRLLNKQQAEEPAGSSSEEEEEERTVAQAATHPVEQPETEERTASEPQEIQEEPARRPEEETSETQSDRHETANNDFDARSDDAPLEEEEEESSVEVFQEVMDPSSALVHMISSDLPESSTVTYTEEGASGGESTEGDEAFTSETNPSPAEAPTDEIESINGQEESPAPNVPTAENGEERRPDVPPASGSEPDSGSPVPPTEHTSAANSSAVPPAKEEDIAGQATSRKLDAGADNAEDEDLFKMASPRPQNAKREEEDEEEVSLKGRPPPAPLFGDEDDDEDDDLDWLG
ncbi:FK506-binding protein 15 [Spea bombifrons]|uniref:FK506-binding protein 15 n=1 Tax=Spea bombifrons TaxID=233779 RepID=UPI00234A4F88|nr:FK506-binding protein 15 [Spea bombifrons]